MIQNLKQIICEGLLSYFCLSLAVLMPPVAITGLYFMLKDIGFPVLYIVLAVVLLAASIGILALQTTNKAFVRKNNINAKIRYDSIVFVFIFFISLAAFSIGFLPAIILVSFVEQIVIANNLSNALQIIHEAWLLLSVICIIISVFLVASIWKKDGQLDQVLFKFGMTLQRLYPVHMGLHQ